LLRSRSLAPVRRTYPAVIVNHLYVHVPFCAHRCGYCDFVTVTGHEHVHAAYVDALLRELELERHLLADPLETVFVGGGTPTLLGPELLARLLDGLPRAREELTVEANPETVSDALAAVLAERGVRVSLGAQSFGAAELAVLERRADPDTVRTAVARLRAAGVTMLSLDLIHGVPGQDVAAVERDLDEAIALAPEHLSCYELEAKPGTRFTHRHGAELARQAASMEGYLDVVVERLEAAGYRWYEIANFCRDDARARHNLAYWTGRDYLGIGIGAVSTLGLTRRTVRPRLAPYIDALAGGSPPPRAHEQLTASERDVERVMLGLRLDVPLAVERLGHVVDTDARERLVALGMVAAGAGTLQATRRGRMLLDDVVASLVAT
jgi:putative oxygen-independent coproporphyrinogen III oxidase